MQVEDAVSENVTDVITEIAREVGTDVSAESEATTNDPVVRKVNFDAQLAQKMADEVIPKAMYFGEDSTISTDEDLLTELIRVTTWQKW